MAAKKTPGKSTTKTGKKTAKPKAAASKGITLGGTTYRDAHTVNALFPFFRPHLRGAARTAINNEAKQAIQAMLGVKLGGHWPTLQECVPPGSLLEEIMQAFEATTDIPLEIPVFATLHYISALLLQKEVVIEFANGEVRPDIWSVCLAESGAGKTYAQSMVKKSLDADIRMFNDFASAAKFMEELRDNNKGLWSRDEFAQFLKQLEVQPHMSEAKDYLLRCYDNSPITRATKGETITVEDPALVIFGSTVFSTFRDNITQEMLLDGFAQRFAYIVAERDPDRGHVAIYRMQDKVADIKRKWHALSSGKLLPQYRVDKVSEKAFEEAFSVLLARANSADVPLSYFRRILFRAVKYALIYHILLGKPGAVLDKEDFGYAARVCALNLRDLRKLLDQFQLSEFQALAEKAEAYVRRKQVAGEKTTPSKLLAGVRGVGNANNARSLLDYLLEAKPELGASIELGKAQAAPVAKGHLRAVK